MIKIDWKDPYIIKTKHSVVIGLVLIFFEVLFLYSSTKFIYKDLVKTIDDVSIYSKILQISKNQAIQHTPKTDYYKFAEYNYEVNSKTIGTQSSLLYHDLINNYNIDTNSISKIYMEYLGRMLIDDNISNDLITVGGIMDLLKKSEKNNHIFLGLTKVIEELNKKRSHDIKLPVDVVIEFKHYINRFYISQIVLITVVMTISYFKYFGNIYKMEIGKLIILLSILMVIIIAVFRLFNISADTFSYSDFVNRTLTLNGNGLFEIVAKVYIPTLYLIFYEIAAFYILILTAFEFIKSNVPQNIEDENKAIAFVSQLMLHVYDKE